MIHPDKEYTLTVNDLVRIYKLPVRTIQRWANCNKIPGVKFGSEWRFARQDMAMTNMHKPKVDTEGKNERTDTKECDIFS